MQTGNHTAAATMLAEGCSAPAGADRTGLSKQSRDCRQCSEGTSLAGEIQVLGEEDTEEAAEQLRSQRPSETNGQSAQASCRRLARL